MIFLKRLVKFMEIGNFEDNFGVVLKLQFEVKNW